jgi:RNA-directed DNA polymerase
MGGKRKICAPVSGIKFIQKNLSLILNELCDQKFCVHGYVKDRSIITNAKAHSRKRIIVNLDLKNYFPSINFGRVRGLFKAPPFLFNDEVATTLAQICCYENSLPQGAPSSPIISNYICRRLDSQLSLLCRDCKVDYSRYADDLTFSTNLKELPLQIGTITGDKLTLSKEIKAIIKGNGFTVNRKKNRFALKNNRQDVTGLIVNEGINVPRKYVRHVRAMLHAWEKYGLENAAKEHFEKYNYKHKVTDYPEISFKNELVGKISYIGQIKGTGNRIYISLYSRIKKQDHTVKLAVPKHLCIPVEIPIIFCEGHTDSLHLQAALDSLQHKGEFVDLNVHFYKWPEHININNNDLFDMCRTRPKAKVDSRLEIFLFDRDDKRYTKDTCADGKLYKHWEAKVYSALLPVPAHRDFDEICIEHYYSDADIKIEDDSGYRLYLSDEFEHATGNHHSVRDLYFAANRGILKSKYPKIIENNVKILGNDKNVALPKKQFAKHIAAGNGRFKGVSFDNFRPIFQLIEDIMGLPH